jgi:hypothetical protein
LERARRRLAQPHAAALAATDQQAAGGRSGLALAPARASDHLHERAAPALYRRRASRIGNCVCWRLLKSDSSANIQHPRAVSSPDRLNPAWSTADADPLVGTFAEAPLFKLAKVAKLTPNERIRDAGFAITAECRGSLNPLIGPIDRR